MRVEELEAAKAISSRVSEELTKELDRLGQYTRRSNLVMRNVFLPEKETNEELTEKITKLIKTDLKLPNAAKDIDKLHRIGKVKQKDGGKVNQDVIIKFKSHTSRYAVFSEKKKLRNIRISPNLTKRRGKMLYDAGLLTETIDSINFVYANVHGDLKLRLVKEIEGKHVFSFDSIDNLNKIIRDMGLKDE